MLDSMNRLAKTKTLDLQNFCLTSLSVSLEGASSIKVHKSPEDVIPVRNWCHYLANLTSHHGNTKATYIPIVAGEKKGPPNPSIKRIDMWSLLRNR